MDTPKKKRKPLGPGYVYIAINPAEVVKVGYTSGLQHRTTGLKGYGFTIIWTTEWQEEAFFVEQTAHLLLKTWKIRNELFQINIEAAKLAINLAIEGVKNKEMGAYHSGLRKKKSVRGPRWFWAEYD